MNKYTLRITNFFDGNFASYLNTYNTLPNHPLIKKIQNIYNSVESEPLILDTTTEYKKMHHIGEEGLIFIIFKELFEDNLIKGINQKDLESIQSFNMWYRLNHAKINLQEILKSVKNQKKYKNFYDVMYSSIKNRKDLHTILYKNSFISLDNIQHAESSTILYKHYKNSKIDLSLYLPSEENKNNVNSANIFDEPNIEIISKIFSFMSDLFGKKNEKLKLVVFYGNQKKLLNYESNQKILCSDNVNSGLSVKHELIMIWRKEEFYKVLIHELVHFFGIDFYVLDSIYKSIEKSFNEKYKVIGSDKINESYTEAIAIFLHSIVYAKENKKNVDDIMKYEIMFSHFQMAKILNYFDCPSFENLGNTEINQNTSVFSYYIIKTLLMVNYKKLFDFWDENGFQILDGNEEKYGKLYNDILNENNIDITTLNFFINYIRNGVSKFGNSFIFRTMRMSCFSI
jgi:hypothetical protein